jgi:hypothetical protein
LRFLRYLYVSLIFLMLSLSSCYVPNTGPEIYGSHISCHWNGSFDDYIWIFQVWVDHSVSPDEVKETNIFLWDAQANKNFIPLEYSDSTLWKNIPKEEDTTLECGRWYLVEIITFDNQGLHDYFETSYQK